ncbi:MAG: hypothetical protein KBC28_08535 [Alphaproteobacteria bacterium]|nr:hypothetical protein [Alphaproteobacteria bacterium]
MLQQVFSVQLRSGRPHFEEHSRLQQASAVLLQVVAEELLLEVYRRPVLLFL